MHPRLVLWRQKLFSRLLTKNAFAPSTLSYRIAVAQRVFILQKSPSAMPLFDPPRFLIFMEWSLYVMNKNRYILHIHTFPAMFIRSATFIGHLP